MDCHKPSVLAMTVCGVGSRNDKRLIGRSVCHTEIATAFSKPRNDRPRINKIATSSTNSRNDGSFFVIARSETTKQSTTTNSQYKNKKEKEFTTLIPLRHCEGRRPVAIHKPQNPHQKTENKKNSLLFIKLKN